MSFEEKIWKGEEKKMENVGEKLRKGKKEKKGYREKKRKLEV
jgi:hypothetical protein